MIGEFLAAGGGTQILVVTGLPGLVGHTEMYGLLIPFSPRDHDSYFSRHDGVASA